MFKFFSKRNNPEPVSLNPAGIDETINKSYAAVEIPENIFIEKNGIPISQEKMADRPENNIELLFDFLDKNHEAKGYDDALINPDVKHLEQNLEALRNQLERTIRRVRTFYEDFIKEIDFHIDSRSRSGMVDVVDELKMKKSIAESHIQKVLEIEEETRSNKGDSQGMIMSYTRGFMNGLSAISHHSILRRF